MTHRFQQIQRAGRLSISVLALLAIVSLSTTQAQTTNGAVLGDVADPSANPVSRAQVTLRNIETAIARTTATDDAGRFRFLPVLPGRYELEVAADGFKNARRSPVIVEAAAQVKADFRLTLGSVSETVEVSSAAPILQTQDGSVGGVVTESELKRLPVNGRNYTRLILLMPGTSTQGGSQSQGTFSGTALFSVNGQRQQDNNYTLDGVDNNFLFQNSPGASPPMDSISEFRVLSNTSAEFGRSAGANVSLVTKSGTRDLHGSAYEYLRNEKLDANSFFGNKLGIAKLPFRQNQYGASAGGPLVIPKLYNGRDHTFWFANWEGFRQRQGQVRISSVPTLAQRQGDFSDTGRNIYDPFSGIAAANGQMVRQLFPGRRIPASRFNAAAALYLREVIPMPTSSGIANNLVNTQSTINDRDLGVIRVDRSFGNKDSMFFRYNRQNVSFVNPTDFPTVRSQSQYNVNSLGVSWTHIFTPSTVLEGRFGLNNPYLPIYDVNRQVSRQDFIARSGLTMFEPNIPGGALPGLNASGVFSYPVGTGGGGRITEDKVFEPAATLSHVAGQHSLKAGFLAQIRHYFQDAADPMNGTATFDNTLTSATTDRNSGYSVASLLLGVPSSVRRASGNTLTNARGPLQAYFLQDDFRATRRLTLNLGLRYEYTAPPYALSNELGTLDVVRDPATGAFSPVLLWAGSNSFTGQGPNRQGYGRGLQTPDRNNFAPRIGFAYQATASTVLRGAYGIFYNSSFFQEMMDMRKFYPYVPQQNFTANRGVRPDLLITDAGPAYTTNIGGWAQSPHKSTPYSQQWNFTLQQKLAPNLSWELAYFGSANTNQIGYTQSNQAVQPGPGSVNLRRPLTSIGDITTGINEFNSNYNSFRTTLVKRFSHGSQFNVNYTWGKVLTGQSSLNENVVQDQYNRSADYGRASYDVAHTFQAAYVCDVPFGRGRRFGSQWSAATDALLGGWAIEGITRIQTGALVNVSSGVDRANVGASQQRPDVSRNPNTGGSRNADANWFDTGAFSLPAAYTFGNAGVNVVETDGRTSWDVAVQKRWTFFESQALQFRTELFNAPNHTNFGAPTTNFSSAAFGKVNSATTGRQIQFGLRYSF